MSHLNVPAHKGKPDWLKTRLLNTEKYEKIAKTVKDLNINTICGQMKCPNIQECWGKNNVAITIMGDICTRACNNCTPGYPTELDRNEIHNIVKCIKNLDIDYITLNCTKRDDLKYMGADYIAECIRTIKKEIPWAIIEVIIPDFKGDVESIHMVVESKPNVITHNVDTVKSLHKEHKDPRDNFDRSIEVLKTIKELDFDIYTKSMILLGLGERKEEVIKAMQSLRGAKVDILVLGQYMKAKEWHSDTKEYVHPLVLDYLKTVALNMGFLKVNAKPFSRSSHMAGDLYINTFIKRMKKNAK